MTVTSSGTTSVAFDTGGTFTDVVVADDERGVVIEKELSTPDAPTDAILRGVERGLERLGRSFSDVAAVYGATTLVTNALIERAGARTALVATHGFSDVIEMRREDRFDIYDLAAELPSPYVPRNLRFEVCERMNARGRAVVELHDDEIARVIDAVLASDADSVAVCLLHAYANPLHEQMLRHALARDSPDLPVTISSEIAPEIREFERMSTTVINAYTQPVMARNVEGLSRALAGHGFAGTVYFMLSSGRIRLASFVSRFPAYVVESGPAAGAIMAAHVGRSAGHRDLVSLDMGGTTAKVCFMPRGRPRITRTFEVARTTRFKKGSGHPLRLPSVDLIEIGAGGGSVADIDNLGRLQVGPASVGAHPGPACYGRGSGSATVTDANLVLGYLDPSRFLGGEMRLDEAAASRAIDALAARCGMGLLDTAWGIHTIANEHMARAARVQMAELGVDARDFTMVAFGGAGPAHACRVAASVGIRRILFPLGAGVGSAIGLLLAPPGVDYVSSLPGAVESLDLEQVQLLLDSLLEKGRDALTEMGLSADDLDASVAADLRYVGQGQELEVPATCGAVTELWRDALVRSFHDVYAATYGRSFAHLPVEAVNWHVSIIGPGKTVTIDASEPASVPETAPSWRQAFFPELSGLVDAAVFDRGALSAGWEEAGPLIVFEKESTIVVPPAFVASLDAEGNLVASSSGSAV